MEWKLQRRIAKFGDNPININVEILKKGFNKSAVIEIVNSNSINDINRHVSNVDCENENIREWKVNYIGKMTEYNHHEFEPIDDETYKKEAKHEFGHFMGLGDAYNGALANKEVSVDDIMWKGEKISSNDIEMILMAALKNKKQYFYSKDGKIISEAITV